MSFTYSECAFVPLVIQQAKRMRRIALSSVACLVLPKCFPHCLINSGTAVAQWLRCSVTNRKVAGSIPAGVSGFFIDIKSFLSHYGHGVDCNRNEYQEHFLGVKTAGA